MVKQAATIQTIQVEGDSLILLIEDQTPYVRYKEHHFLSLIPLFEALPILYEPSYAKECAIVVNFLVMGEHCHVIDTHDENYPISRFGKFDLSALHPPKHINHQLIFFIHDNTDGLPYRVTCPIPFTEDSHPIRYELLPYV